MDSEYTCLQEELNAYIREHYRPVLECMFSISEAYSDEFKKPRSRHSTPRPRNRMQNEGYLQESPVPLGKEKADMPEELEEAKIADAIYVKEMACNYELTGESRLFPKAGLDELLHRKQMTFSEKLLQIIDARKLKDADVYKGANIDRRLFSKMRNKNYNPKKNTVLALIIGLQLNMEEAKELMSYAGFAFRPSDLTDVIVQYFIEKGYYNIYEINNELYTRGEKLLGEGTPRS